MSMEELKKCTKCLLGKSFGEFSKKYKDKNGVQKYSTICKKCTNEYLSVYRNIEKNKLKQIDYDKEYYEKNREKILKRKKDYHKENQEIILEKKRKYRKIPKNKERAKEYIKKYKVENRDKYYQYRRNNPHIIAWRRMLYRTLYHMGTKKEGTTQEMLGYSAVQLKHRIEKQFTEGMTWSNYGEWEIDHIMPLTSFDSATDPSIVNSLDNLQPLWKEENMAKFNNII